MNVLERARLIAELNEICRLLENVSGAAEREKLAARVQAVRRQLEHIPVSGNVVFSQLFEKAMANKGGNALYSDFAVVNERTAQIAKEATGLDIGGWKHSIGETEIRHIIKRHGDEQTEQARGQRAVTQADILKLPEILADFDHIEYVGENEQGNDAFLVSKIIDGEVFCVQEIRRRRKKLVVKTMWIKKSRKPTPSA